MRLASHSFILLLCRAVLAAVTVYNQTPLGIATQTANAASYTGAAAYNPTILIPPPPPNPPNPNQFNIQVQSGGAQGMSVPQPGNFFGFSIEFSVVTQVLGRNSTWLQVPFLNLMSNLKRRAGSVQIRVGGNTQDTATLVDSLPDGGDLEKDKADSSNPTQTPPLLFTPEILYMMGNISALIDVYWFLGIPFNDTTNWRLAIAQTGQAVLGDYLLGLQTGNEPDLYAAHGHRPATYAPQDYMNELSSLIQAMNDPADAKNRNILIAPNIATGAWTPQMMIDAGFVAQFSQNLYSVAVEHYPTDNCFVQYGIGINITSQQVFPSFLQHSSAQGIVQPYIGLANIAQQAQKPMMMFETNTASCGGFPGVSDSFGAALWGVDYALQMAWGNFTGALFHVGGQDDYYNPFTPPPTNQSSFRHWTIGPIYYSAVVVAEVMGSSNKSQIMDLNANAGNTYTPAYAIYEAGVPSRVVLINFVDDPSGANDYVATIDISGVTPPSQVQVKYLLAPSVSSKAVNITWAGQTLGGNFESDGRFIGSENITTIQCNTGASSCAIPVPAPAMALVFLTSQALSESESTGAPHTFSTTIVKSTYNTATVGPGVLATSNGHQGLSGGLGTTSRERVSAAFGVKIPGLVGIMWTVGCALVLSRAW